MKDIKITTRKPGRLATAVNKQPLNLRLDAALILRLKHQALREGQTVSDIVAELVDGYLDAREATP